MYVFYTKLNDTKGRIDAVYQEEQVSEELKEKGISVPEIPEMNPEEGQEAVMMIDLITHQITVEYYELNQNYDSDALADVKSRLKEAEGKLQTAEEYYQNLNPESVSLAELKAAKSAELEYQYKKAVHAGFQSESTGFRLGFTEEDQKNISNQMIVFLADPEKKDCQWKTENAGVQTLTREEFLKILPESEDHTRTNITKLWTLRAKVEAATTKENVQKVVW